MIHLNDTDYTSEMIMEHREVIIALRDALLVVNDFEWSATLSITIGLLYELAWKERVEEAQKNK